MVWIVATISARPNPRAAAVRVATTVPCCNDRYPHPVCGNLEGIEVVSWLPLFRHAEEYTFMV